MREGVGPRAKVLAGLTLGLLPSCLAVILKSMTPLPFWAWHYDPEAAYFHAGQSLLRGELPVIVEHPGTPLQLLGAGLLAASGRTILDLDALRATGYWVSLALMALTSVALMQTVLKGLPTLVGASCFWFVASFGESLTYRTIWAPETLLPSFAALTLSVAWRYFDRPTTPRLLVVATLVGACLGLKFSLLGWAVALLPFAPQSAPSRRLWDSLRSLGVTFVGFGVGFVSMTWPIARGYARLGAFLERGGLEAGPYGGSGAWEPFTAQSAANAWQLLMSSSLWHAVLAGALVAVGLNLRSGRARVAPPHFLVFCLAAMVPSYVLYAKSPAMRYMAPAALAAGPVLAAAWRAVLLANPRRSSVLLCVGALLLLVTKAGVQDYGTHCRRLSQDAVLRAKVDATLAPLRRHDSVVIFGWRLPQPSFALRIHCQNERDMEAIEARYPGEGHYNPWVHRVWLPSGASTWDLLVIGRSEVAGFPEGLGLPVAEIDEYLVFQRVPSDPAGHSFSAAESGG